MSDIINIYLNLQAGYTYTLHIPTTLANDGGFAPYTDAITLNGESKTPQNGFVLESEVVGKIKKVHSDKVAIDYQQLLPSPNIIWFYAFTGERVRISAAPMIVHDHSSVSQGGPAYGTYASYLGSTTEDTGGSS